MAEAEGLLHDAMIERKAPDPDALRHQRKSTRIANDARLGKLEMTLGFLQDRLPAPALCISAEAGSNGPEGFSMLGELPDAMAKAYSRAIVSMLDFVAEEYARGRDGRD